LSDWSIQTSSNAYNAVSRILPSIDKDKDSNAAALTNRMVIGFVLLALVALIIELATTA